MRGHSIPDADRLRQIKDAIGFIQTQCAGLSDNGFYADEVLKRAVVRELEIIGEAANLISPQLKQSYPAVPWRQIVNTRHKIIHEYFHVNYVTVGVS